MAEQNITRNASMDKIEQAINRNQKYRTPKDIKWPMLVREWVGNKGWCWEEKDKT